MCNCQVFGVQLSGRTFTATTVTKKYRMGYQGSEMDNEVKPGSDGLATGNSYTTEFRQLDPRLGRWLSMDPKSASFPHQSPYCSMDNNPIRFNDQLGLEAKDWIRLKGAGKNGENLVAYDSRVTDQESAELYYPSDVEYLPVGNIYPTSRGQIIELLFAGEYALDGKTGYKSPDQAGSTSQNESSVTGGSIVPYLHIDEGYAEQEWHADKIRRQIGAIHDFVEGYVEGIAETALFIGTAGTGSFVSGTFRAGLTKGFVSSTINFSGQVAGNGGSLGKVDYASCALDFVGGFIPNQYLSTSITGSVDAFFDWTPDAGPSYYRNGKSGAEAVNDLFFNVVLGNTTNALEKNSKGNEGTAKGADFLFQLFNTSVGNVLTEDEK